MTAHLQDVSAISTASVCCQVTWMKQLLLSRGGALPLPPEVGGWRGGGVFSSFNCNLPQILTTPLNVKAFARQTSSKSLEIGTIYRRGALEWLEGAGEGGQ